MYGIRIISTNDHHVEPMLPWFQQICEGVDQIQ